MVSGSPKATPYVDCVGQLGALLSIVSQHQNILGIETKVLGQDLLGVLCIINAPAKLVEMVIGRGVSLIPGLRIAKWISAQAQPRIVVEL